MSCRIVLLKSQTRDPDRQPCLWEGHPRATAVNTPGFTSRVKGDIIDRTTKTLEPNDLGSKPRSLGWTNAVITLM